MSDIFISYQREETGGHARGIYRHLTYEFGSSAVFMDTATINPGEKWPKRLETEVNLCQVMLPIIGKRWVKPSLNDVSNWVRNEISSAISNRKHIIPVLVDGANVPSKDHVPAVLKPMLSRQPVWLNHRDNAAYERDLESLAEKLSAITGSPTKKSTSIIYLRRLPKYAVSGFNFKIYLDDEKLGEISNSQVKKFEISPGRHSMYLQAGTPKFGWFFQSISDKLSFSIKGGETKKFICSANAISKEKIDLDEEFL